MPDPPFGSTIGKTYQDFKSEWPKLPTPPDGAPNVVIILLDDVGFGQVSTFGGPVPIPPSRRPGRARAPVHPISHGRHLRPVTRGADYRSKPSQLWGGVPRGMGDGLPQSATT
jgi:hypothetical protein